MGIVPELAVVNGGRQDVDMKQRGEGTDEDLVRLYLNDIGRYPMLSKADEVRLAQEIEIGRDARERLAAGGALTLGQKTRVASCGAHR